MRHSRLHGNPADRNARESPLPTLDSTRLLAKYAILEALSDRRSAQTQDGARPPLIDVALRYT